MVRPLYSALLYSNNSVSSTVLSPAVPVGFIWDIRQINMSSYGAGGGSLGFLRVQDTSNVTITQVTPWESFMGCNIDWEGRHVLNAGDKIVFAPDSGPWSVRVTGYILTVP